MVINWSQPHPSGGWGHLWLTRCTNPTGFVELGKLRADTSLVFQPSVFLANALAAFALNLVSAALCRPLQHLWAPPPCLAGSNPEL